MNPRHLFTRVGQSRTAVLSQSTHRRALLIALVAVAVLAVLAAGCRGPRGGKLKGPGIHIH